MKIHGHPAARFLASRVLWASRLSSFFTIQADGYRLRFYPSSFSAGMWCDPKLTTIDETLLKQVLRPGDIFVDVGANIGCLTLAAWSIVGPTGRIFSIEAHPKTVEYLRGNIYLNRAKNISVIHCAAGETHGDLCFSSKRSDEQNHVVSHGVKIPVRPLDEVLPHTSIRLLKIDVEGFELFVLKGAQKILQQVDYVYLESWDEHFNKYGYSSRDVISFLQKSGFSVPLPDNHASVKLENILFTRSSGT